MSEWISVKDRLPEKDQKVLLIVHGWEPDLIYVGKLHHNGPSVGIFGEGKESDWSINGWSYYKQPEVTHWMPLPEPPKESEDME